MGKVGGEGFASLYVASIMLGLCWLTVSARLGVRVWKRTLGVDDWLMSILYSVTACLVIAACYHGSGQKTDKINPIDIPKGIKIFYVAEYFYASCTVPIKWSISVCLLRIADTRRSLVYVIWGVMAMSAAATIIFISAIANICHPIQTLWGAADGECNNKLNSSASFFFSAVSIITDWTLATVPVFLLWRIQMKPRVKFSCIVMLSLGVFASCATIVRLRYLTLYNDISQFMYSTGAIGLWSILEEGIGILSGSMPALRPLLNLSFLSSTSYNLSDDTAGVLGLQTIGGTGSKKKSHRRISEEQEQERDNDGDSQKQILKETQISVMQTQGSQSTEQDWTKRQVLGWQHP